MLPKPVISQLCGVFSFGSRISVRKPCAIVVPKGLCVLQRSGSVWIQ